MSDETKLLREQIRQGVIVCRCKLQGGHYPGCAWANAIDRIYEVERKEEGITP